MAVRAHRELDKIHLLDTLQRPAILSDVKSLVHEATGPNEGQQGQHVKE